MGIAVDTGATKVYDKSFTNPVDGAAVKIEVLMCVNNTGSTNVASSCYIVIDGVLDNVLAEYPLIWVPGYDTKIVFAYIGGLSIGPHEVSVYLTGSSSCTIGNCSAIADFRFN